MRDRLIDIIKQCTCHYSPPCDGDCGLCKNVEIYDEQIEHIADHLLANGVIVPPCKVGDIVYFANESYHDSAEIDGIHIDENGISFTWAQYDFGVDITELWDDGEFNIDEIGKTVFLTREEAERALKGGEG